MREVAASSDSLGSSERGHLCERSTPRTLLGMILAFAVRREIIPPCGQFLLDLDMRRKRLPSAAP